MTEGYKTAKFGLNQGLTLLFDVEAFDDALTRDGSAGLVAGLVQSTDLPNIGNTMVRIAPGTHKSIGIEPTFITVGVIRIRMLYLLL